MQRFVLSCLTVLVGLGAFGLDRDAHAAGTLTPVSSQYAPIEVVDHHVDVVLNNGFARTAVTQTFFNPNADDLEAIYAMPIPKSASLSEMTIFIGETEIHGEVIAKDDAERIYETEASAGNDAGLAVKNEFYTYEFRVSPVRAGDQTRIRFIYYQPLEVDTGIGRYVYPLEEGGTDDAGASFWLQNDEVSSGFSVAAEIKSAVPLVDVRVPGYEAAALVNRLTEGHYKVDLHATSAVLNRDFVIYYRLQENLPGRVELIPYRADEDAPGTFMLVVTPGIDLQPLSKGADYVFVLDVSGSMNGDKLGTLSRGVAKAIGELRPEDRFRVVTFSDKTCDITHGWLPATPENVAKMIVKVEGLKTEGGTNLYAGIQEGLSQLDDDRATSLVLVTDAVANRGVIDPKDFYRLLSKYDIRVFGFLMGNSGNWPLMRTVANASGGFYAGVSNSDDILGQIMLAKSKVTHEALHDAEVELRGVKTFALTNELPRKVYRGEQLVIFGKYKDAGKAELRLTARMSGEDKVYSTEFEFPETATENPEIERLWALSKIEGIEDQMNAGLLKAKEGEHAIRDLGVAYQLVTDETSMIVLHDEDFERHGIDRRNRDRVQDERQAQARRASQPAQNHRVDSKKPMFNGSAPSLGGGAFDPVSVILVMGAAGLCASTHRKKEGGERKERDDA